MSILSKLLLLSLTLFAVLISACRQETSHSVDPDKTTNSSSSATQAQQLQDTQSSKPAKPIANILRNWAEIQQSGIIRALNLEWEEETSLPRSGSTSLYHIELFNQFAIKHDLQIQWIKVKDLEQMFKYLADHKADLIPRHLTITQNRLKSMSFTHSVLQDIEVLVAKKGSEIPSRESSITVTVPNNTAYKEAIEQHFPNWKIAHTKGALNSEEIADALVAGTFSYSVLDGMSVNTLLSYRNDVVELMNIPKTRELAWAVNLKNITLLDKLNEFIAVHHIAATSRKQRKNDLKIIQQNNLTLRIITRNSPETYFLWRGELMGFEYELMRKFAKQHKIRLEVIVADNYQQMKNLLTQGQGDIIAAALSRNEQRKSELQFSHRYNRVSELIVAHKDALQINSLADLKERSISVRKSSAFWTTAQILVKKYGVKLIAADESIPTELLIAQVADKQIDLTIADSNLIGIEQRFRSNIVTPLTLKENVPYAYAVRDNNPQLLKALNAFIKKEYRGTFYNVVKGKYFTSPKRLKRYRQDRITSDSNLSPYDHLVKDNARKYQFDWRLIISQMFQESRFDPNAQSFAGAQGLMQVLPKTAQELGFFDLSQPEQSVAAGIQYLDWTRARFSKSIPLEERVFFALAAYNAGFGHVKDAQRLSKKMQLRPDKWFDNVEKAMLLLQKPEYYKKSRYGYCRGSEPVNYVRDIQQRYLSYVDITH